jgi:hypothetical protein
VSCDTESLCWVGDLHDRKFAGHCVNNAVTVHVGPGTQVAGKATLPANLCPFSHL